MDRVGPQNQNQEAEAYGGRNEIDASTQKRGSAPPADVSRLTNYPAVAKVTKGKFPTSSSSFSSGAVTCSTEKRRMMDHNQHIKAELRFQEKATAGALFEDGHTVRLSPLLNKSDAAFTDFLSCPETANTDYDDIFNSRSVSSCTKPMNYAGTRRLFRATSAADKPAIDIPSFITRSAKGRNHQFNTRPADMYQRPERGRKIKIRQWP